MDILVSAIYGRSHFVGKENDLQTIDQFYKASDFDSLLRDIVFDTVLFGNAFIEKVAEDEGFLKRIDPTSIEIVTSWKQIPPWRSYSEVIDKLIQYIPKKREIHRSAFFHFVGETVTEPIGASVLGFWFTEWYNIAFAKNSQTRGVRESAVIASGVPYHLIYPETQITNVLLKQELANFRLVIKWRRKSISRVIEREILPMFLGRFFDEEETPKFEFI